MSNPIVLPDTTYAALIENSFDLLAAVDSRGTLTFQSPSAERILGYKPEELVGRDAFSLIHPDDRSRVTTQFDIAWRTPGPTRVGEYRFLHKRGGWRLLESVASVVPTLHGSRIGIVNSRDVTDQRTLKDQLCQVERVAALGRIASSVVHEFNNALHVMVLNLDFILESQPGATVLPELEGMKRAAELARGLAARVLEHSRASGAAPQRVDVNASIASLIRVLQRLAGPNIVLATNLRADMAVVLARFGVLDQILVNLVGNARDAIHGSGTVVIETRTIGDRLVLAVSDDGEGVPEGLQGRIFEPFFTTKSSAHGTGLGLSTVRELVEEAGGRIELRSRAGCGATFSVSLPLADSSEACPPLAGHGDEPLPGGWS